jgi:hypothetical protein
VQALLSLQALALSLVNTQPVAGAHESSVQGFLSSHVNAGPPTQALFAQTSLVVQALLSLQGAVFATLAHPVEELQESSVHGLLSLQLVGPLETQLPPLQWSPVVQASPSLQVFELDTVNTQPVAGAQESFVHGLLSLQVGAGPPVQVPDPLHWSDVVQALPSVHPVPAGSVAVQFFAPSLQEVEQLPSVVLRGRHGSPTCTLHAPLEQVSAPLQNTLSLHDVPVWAVQVPGLEPLHVWQSVVTPPPHALVQQTVSTQVSACPD